MNKMVIQCRPDGTAEHTLKDQAFQPFPDATRDIQRMSEILHNKDHQKFYMRFLKGPYPNEDVTWNHVTSEALAIGPRVDLVRQALHFMSHKSTCSIHFVNRSERDVEIEDCDCKRLQQPLLFMTYETAVNFEIMLIDAMRMRGISFAE